MRAKLSYVCFLTVLSALTHYASSLLRNDHENYIENQEIFEKTANCSCVPYYQCSEESGRVITDGDGLLDLRGLEDDACTGYFDVCCNTTVTPNLRPSTPPRTASSTHNASDRGCGYPQQTLVPWSGVLLVSHPTDRPSQKKKWEHKCGVSIIHPKVAVTAAHCLSSPSDSHPGRAGGNPKQFKVKVADHVGRVAKIAPHRGYNTGTLQNDIALLFLESALPKIGPICIPPPGSQLLDRQCTVTTWKRSGKLRIIEVPLVPHQKCERMLRKTRLGKYFQLHLSFLCAGGDSFQDACDGDGGAPLICPVSGQPGRYHQVGIVSWGIGCGEKDTPGVYVNVAAFRPWIDAELLGELGATSDGINAYRYK